MPYFNMEVCNMEAFAVPIKPGKVETWKSWVSELSGSRKAEYDDMNARMGLTLHAAWLQENPDGSSFVIVVQDGPGAPDFLARLASSENETDAWFRSMVADIHPLDFSGPLPPPNQRFA